MGARFASLCMFCGARYRAFVYAGIGRLHMPIRTCVTQVYTHSRYKITTNFANNQIKGQKNAKFVYFLRQNVDFCAKETKQPAICGLFS